MLAYVMRDGRGEVDALLRTVAATLSGDGQRIVGTVQHNTDRSDGRACTMELEVLPSGQMFGISQDLGGGASGCRLDPDGFSMAVHAVQQALETGADLLLINKFGKQEAEGHGFRDLVAQALHEGIPVLIGLNAKNLAAFLTFAEGLAEEVEGNLPAVMGWCRETGRVA